MTEPVRWEIPRKVWFVLLSWGLAVLVLAGLFSFWIQHNQQEQARRAAAVEARAAQQARAIVCFLFTTILDTYQESPPTTAAGRAQVGAWLQVYQLSKCQPPR
jgi:hypothetical protein